VILPTHRVAANVHDFSGPQCAAISSRGSPRKFSRSPTMRKKKRRVPVFLARLKSSAARRAFGAYPAAREGQRAFYLLSLRPGTDLAQLLPNVSPLQRELDVVLLHEGILEPRSASRRSPSPRKRISLRTRSGNALAAVDSGKAQISFLLNACDVEEVVKIATATKSCRKNPPTFPKLLSGITMYRV